MVQILKDEERVDEELATYMAEAVWDRLEMRDPSEGGWSAELCETESGGCSDRGD